LLDLITRYRAYETKAKTVSLSLKCLLKLVQILEKIIHEIKLDQIFYKVHLLVSQIENDAPGLITSNKLDLIIIKFLKNVVFEFAKIKNDAIITEYIKFVEKIDVKDKFIKLWIKEYMNSNSDLSNAKVEGTTRISTSIISKNEKFNNNAENDKSAFFNLNFKANEESNICYDNSSSNKFDYVPPNNNNTKLNINSGNSFLDQRGNLNKNINSLRIHNKFCESEAVNYNNNNDNITNNQFIYLNKNAFSELNLNNRDDSMNNTNPKKHCFLSSSINAISNNNREWNNKNNNYNDYNYYSYHTATNAYNNPDKALNLNKNTIHDDSSYPSSNVIYNNTNNNSKEYKQAEVSKEIEDSHKKFSAGFFKAGESINCNNNSILNNGVNRIQVTKYYI